MLDGTSTTKDERMNAALAHASILLGLFTRGVLGVLLAFLIWVTQRGKSDFARRQAAQAVIWQLCGIAASILAFAVWGFIFAGSIFVPILFNPQNPEGLMPYTMVPAILLVIVPFALIFAWTAIGLIATWQVWHGRDYSYPVVGRWVK